MAKWTWLMPWLVALQAATSVELTTVAARRGDEDSFSMVPCVEQLIIHLEKDLMTSPKRRETLKTLRDALMIITSALRQDPSVWSLLKLRQPTQQSATLPQRIHRRLFRDEDFWLAFELKFDGGRGMELREWLALLCELLVVGYNDGEQSRWLADILAKLSAHALPADVEPVRLSLCVDIVGDEDMVPLATALETICGHQLHSSWFLLSTVELFVHELTDAVSSAIDRIQLLGVSITTVDVFSASYTDDFQACSSRLHGPRRPESRPVRRLSLTIPKTDISLAVYSELLQPQPLSHSTLAVTFCNNYLFDSILLAQLVRDAWPRRTSAVRTLELMTQSLCAADIERWRTAAPLTTFLVRINPDTPAGAKLVSRLTESERNTVVEGKLAIPMVHVRGYDYIALPGGRLLDLSTRKAVTLVPRGRMGTHPSPRAVESPVVLRCTLLAASDGAIPALLALIPECLPMLRCLDLYIGTGATFTNDHLRMIVDAHPLLERLSLAHTSITSLDVLLDAFRGGRCSRLRVVSLDNGDLGFLPFFAALADRRSAIAQTLTELKLSYVDDTDGTYLYAIVDALGNNSVLQFIELVLKRLDQPAIERVTTALRPWHRQPVAVRSKASWSREKLAFLSVFHQDSAPAHKRLASQPPWPQHQRLDYSVLQLILSFAAPCVLRLIHLKHETLRGPYHCNHTYFNCCYMEEVDDELLAL